MPHDVFISYATHDKAVADATCAALEAQKLRCWIAPRDVLAGTEYGESIVNAIAECRAMVLVFSGHANKSPHIRREVERTVSKGKFIVPFRIEDVIPSGALEYCLGNTHWLDALTPPLEKRIGELVDSVRRLLAPSTPIETRRRTVTKESASKHVRTLQTLGLLVDSNQGVELSPRFRVILCNQSTETPLLPPGEIVLRSAARLISNEGEGAKVPYTEEELGTALNELSAYVMDILVRLGKTCDVLAQDGGSMALNQDFTNEIIGSIAAEGEDAIAKPDGVAPFVLNRAVESSRARVLMKSSQNNDLSQMLGLLAFEIFKGSEAYKSLLDLAAQESDHMAPPEARRSATSYVGKAIGVAPQLGVENAAGPSNSAQHVPPITRPHAECVIQFLSKDALEALEALFFLLDLRDAPGNEDNPRRLMRRFERRLARSSVLASDVIRKVNDDFQFAIENQVQPIYDTGEVVRAMVAPALEYLPDEAECFRRMHAFGAETALSFLIIKYCKTSDGHSGGHGECHHGYWMHRRILRHLVEHEYGMAVLPFAAHVMVTETPGPKSRGVNDTVFRLAEKIALNTLKQIVEPLELARRYPFDATHDQRTELGAVKGGTADQTPAPRQTLASPGTFGCKIEWRKPPYSTLLVHVDRPIFEGFVDDQFRRGREGEKCPELYRVLLRCPGIQSVQRDGPYSLLMGHSELAEPEQAVPCITEALRSVTGLSPVIATEVHQSPNKARTKKK